MDVSTIAMYATGEEKKSSYTFRDLYNLGRSLPTCPLRVIALVDFDAWYAQCESVRLGLPEDQPLAVQQWNILIAVNYAAKAAGVKRLVTPDEARLICPNIVLQHVATWREGDSTWAYRQDAVQHMKTDKAALDPYRRQSYRAFELIRSLLLPGHLQKVEKASVDEVFLDLSAQVHELMLERYSDILLRHTNLDSSLPLPSKAPLDWQSAKVIEITDECDAEHTDWDDVALHVGSEIVQSIRHQIYAQLHYTCSAGLASNKTIAKLAAGHNKPNQQTVVRARALPGFISGYKLTKFRGFARKLGHRVVEAFGTDQTTELLRYTLQELRQKLGNDSGTSTYNVIRGIDLSEVTQRTQLQSMLAAKTFIPKANNLEEVDKWLRIMAEDLMARIDEQDAVTSSQRRPKVIALHHAINGRFGPTRSKQSPIPSGVQISAELLHRLARTLLIQISHDGPTWPCLGISVSIAHFEDFATDNRDIRKFFGKETTHRVPNEPVPTELQGFSSSTTSPKRKRNADKIDSQDDLTFTRQVRTRSDSSRTHSSDDDSPADPLDADGGIHSTTTPQSDDFRYCCPRCHNFIDATEVLEHLDWHVAKDIQDG